MNNLLIIVHIFVSLVLILVVLLQSGKGGGMGATFGGASQQIFGGRGAGNFLARVTTVMAIVFFLSSLVLSMMGSRERSVVEDALKSKKDAEATDTVEAGAGIEDAAEPTEETSSSQPPTEGGDETATPEGEAPAPPAEETTDAAPAEGENKPEE